MSGLISWKELHSWTFLYDQNKNIFLVTVYEFFPYLLPRLCIGEILVFIIFTLFKFLSIVHIEIVYYSYLK